MKLDFADASVELLQIDLRGAPASERLAALSPAEHARAARFHFDRDRRRWLAARCALRAALAHASGREAAALQLLEGPFGKPRLDGGPAFNLAHSDDLALLAIGGQHELGVDVEMLRPVEDALVLAASHYTAAEHGWLQSLPPDARDGGFLRLWTRKEACLKAIGTGLSVHPSSFTVGCGAGIEAVTIVAPGVRAALLLSDVDAGPQAVAALAVVQR